MGEKENKTIIFCETKRKTDDITRKLRRDGWPAMCIHGDKSQPEREWVLKEFRSGKAPILLATDVASRGLDVPDIRFVVAFLSFGIPLTFILLLIQGRSFPKNFSLRSFEISLQEDKTLYQSQL